MTPIKISYLALTRILCLNKQNYRIESLPDRASDVELIRLLDMEKNVIYYDLSSQAIVNHREGSPWIQLIKDAIQNVHST